MVTTKVFGPPGTGKTTYGLDLAVQARREDPPRKWLYVTFSKATREHALDVFCKRTGETRRDASPSIRTLHSLAYEAAGRNQADEEKLVTGKSRLDFCAEERIPYKPPAYDLNEDVAFVSAQAQGAGAKLFTGLDLCRQTFRDPEDPSTLREAGGGGLRFETYELLAGLVPKWRAWKEVNKLWEQTDNIELAIESGFLRSGDLLILDEAQDLTPLGWRWFNVLAKGFAETHMVGDDDQSIYNWAGSSASQFLSMPADSTKVLDQSYRLPRSVHKASSSIIRAVHDRQPKQFSPKDAEGRVSRIWPERVAETVRMLAYSGETVLVLARTNFRVGYWAEELTAAGVPHSALRGHTVWDGTLYGAGTALIHLAHEREILKHHALNLLDSLPAHGVLRPGVKAGVKRDRESHYYPDEVRRWFLNPRILPTKHVRTSHKGGFIKYVSRQVTLPLERVRIGTYHASKGLQADAVFVDAKLTNDIVDSIQSHRASRDGELRAAYVACTRALDSLYIVQSKYGLLQ